MKKIILLMISMLLLLSGCNLYIPNKGYVDLEYEYQKFIQDQRNNQETGETQEGVYSYYYEQLSELEKQVYHTILSQLDNFESGKKDIYVDYISEDSFYKVHFALLSDHPEYFWLSKFQAKTRNNMIFSVSYGEIGKQKEEYDRLQKIGDEIVAGIPSEYCTYEKVKYLYEYIIKSTEYVEDAENNQDIRSVFVGRQSVCAGYAHAFKFLCDKAGIPCIYVYGTVEGTAHAWNMVLIGEHYYWVDATWGEGGYGNTDSGNINYHYLCATDKELFMTHVLDKGVQMENYYEADVFDYPTCTDDSYNYYKLMNCYFESYDRETVGNYIANKLENGHYDEVVLQFADQATYMEAKRDLFEGQGQKGYITKIIRKSLWNSDWKNIGYSYLCDDDTNYIAISVYEATEE